MDKTRSLLISVLFAACLASPHAEAAALHRYTVRLDADLNSFDVLACFDGQPPRILQTASGEAPRYLESFRIAQSGKQLYPDGRYIRLGRLAENACVEYRVNAGAATAGQRDGMGLATRVGDDLLVSPQLWFWRSRTMDADTDIELVFELPAGVNVSHPWQTIRHEPERVVCRVGHTPYSWPATVAFGDFEVHPLSVDSMTLRLAILGSSESEKDKLRAWLYAALENLRGAYGGLPQQTPQVIVVPLGERDEPVPFGRVIRGGTGAVQFFVDPSYSLSRFTSDWTATHELSHLLLPFVGRSGAWLSEGLATYYQNVLMARSGEYSEQKAWQKLHEGFQRGIRNTKRGQTLNEATRNMRRDGAYMRVYWTGTAIALLADLELRARSGGRMSLDRAMREIGDCCVPAQSTWQARELMERLDKAAGEEVFVPLYERYTDSSDFPDLQEAYRLLGIRVEKGTVLLDRDAPLSPVREAIMKKTGELIVHEDVAETAPAP